MGAVPQRAARFTYLSLEIDGSTMRGHFESDGTTYTETVEFSHSLNDNADAVRAIGELWYLIAGLSYYKARVAHTIDVRDLRLGVAGHALLRAAIRDGLGEFAFRNGLDLDDVTIVGGATPDVLAVDVDPARVVVPFGGGIDSVVTVRSLSSSLDASLFVMSPPSGLFAPLEETAAVMGLPIQRVTRTLDPRITQPNSENWNGHVPVTAMVTLLATVSALATGRGGVVMSNEHSASIPNLTHHGREVNHQWSKSWAAEQLLGDAIAERCAELTVASFLRDKSELWVAREFSHHDDVMGTFRSCNRAFRQNAADRARTWCGECDKCLFINLVLAPFLPVATLDKIFGDTAPLRRPEMANALRTLVGLGSEKKPFECVGDPDECAVALHEVAALPDYSEFDFLKAIDAELSHDRTLDELLVSQGVSRVPTSWIS